MTANDTATTSPETEAHGAGRVASGFGWGLVATVAMSVVMIAGVVTGLSPMPKPIPMALVARTFGGALAKPALMALGAASHLLYGGIAGAVLALIARPVTVGKAVAWALALWLLMQLVWLPYLGWGLFGGKVTFAIAGATLLLHLIYGVTLGWLLDRDTRAVAA